MAPTHPNPGCPLVSRDAGGRGLRGPLLPVALQAGAFAAPNPHGLMVNGQGSAKPPTTTVGLVAWVCEEKNPLTPTRCRLPGANRLRRVSCLLQPPLITQNPNHGTSRA